MYRTNPFVAAIIAAIIVFTATFTSAIAQDTDYTPVGQSWEEFLADDEGYFAELVINTDEFTGITYIDFANSGEGDFYSMVEDDSAGLSILPYVIVDGDTVSIRSHISWITDGPNEFPAESLHLIIDGKRYGPIAIAEYHCWQALDRRDSSPIMFCEADIAAKLELLAALATSEVNPRMSLRTAQHRFMSPRIISHNKISNEHVVQDITTIASDPQLQIIGLMIEAYIVYGGAMP